MCIDLGSIKANFINTLNSIEHLVLVKSKKREVRKKAFFYNFPQNRGNNKIICEVDLIIDGLFTCSIRIFDLLSFLSFV